MFARSLLGKIVAGHTLIATGDVAVAAIGKLFLFFYYLLDLHDNNDYRKVWKILCVVYDADGLVLLRSLAVKHLLRPLKSRAIARLNIYEK